MLCRKCKVLQAYYYVILKDYSNAGKDMKSRIEGIPIMKEVLNSCDLQ